MSTMIATDLEEFYGSRYDESLRLTSSVKGQLELARVRELLTRHMPTAADSHPELVPASTLWLAVGTVRS